MTIDLEKMTIQQLKQLCRDNEYEGFSVQKKKADLILFIENKQQENQPEVKEETEVIKIGFTGNRYGLNSEQIVQIISILDKYDNLIVSHVDCIGSDTDFHNLCMNYRNKHSNKKIKIYIFPPIIWYD